MEKLERTFKKSDAISVLAQVAEYCKALDDKEYILTIRELKAKRSLDANAYCWTLIDKLAERLNMAKTEIYRAYIKEIGGNSYLVCCVDKAVDDLVKLWAMRGIGWVAEVEDSKINGCKNVRLYYGSSVYDTAQMSRLINLVVQDCKTYGIETLTPEELDRLNADWGAK